jgi:hypothetical protein
MGCVPSVTLFISFLKIDDRPPPGASTVIFGLAMYFSCFLNKRRPVSTLLLGAMVGLYAMSTAHFSLVFYNVYQGLVCTSVSVKGRNFSNRPCYR